jgi:hypothetical protein
MGRTAHCAVRASQEDCLPAEPWRCGSGLLPWEARLGVDSLGTLSALRASFFAFWVLAHLLLNYDAGRGLPCRGPAGGRLLRCARLACPRLRLPCFCLGLRAGARAERVAGGAKALRPETLSRAIRHRRWRAVHARSSRPGVSDRREPGSGKQERGPERVHRWSVPATRRATKASCAFFSKLLTCRCGADRRPAVTRRAF